MSGRIERGDLEAKLGEIKEAVDETTSTAKNTGAKIAVGVVVLIFIVYLLGRRKGGKTKGARIEVYRL